MEIKTTNSIIDEYVGFGSLLLEEDTYEGKYEKWVRVDSEIKRIEELSNRLFRLGVTDKNVFNELTIFYNELSQSSDMNAPEKSAESKSPDTCGDKVSRCTPDSPRDLCLGSCNHFECNLKKLQSSDSLVGNTKGDTSQFLDKSPDTCGGANLSSEKSLIDSPQDSSFHSELSKDTLCLCGHQKSEHKRRKIFNGKAIVYTCYKCNRCLDFRKVK